MTLVGRWTARQLCLAVGYMYPLYKSSRALRRQDKHELLEWTTFWTTNALFWVVELVGDMVISWVPFYFEAKIALLLWLVLPQYHGARVLHDKWLAPTFEKHEEVIDVAITDIKRRASGMVMQVCKDTAAMAIKRGSGVMAQGQQYVATQLVQQAMGKLSQPAAGESSTQELRVPAIMSFLTTAVTSTATTPSPSPPVRKSIVVPPILSEAKEAPVKEDKKPHDSEAKKPSKQVSESKEAQAKAEAKGETLEDNCKADEVSQAKKPASPKRRPAYTDTKTALPPPTRAQDKSKELLTHFKKLMVKGFKLSYYPSEGDAKNRSLSLASPQSRYLMFESSSQTDSAKAKKSVKMFILNIRRVAATKVGEEGVPATIDETRAFAIDNGKSILVFEAESTKTRDLLVAGMRLLVNEHKRQDTIALTALTYWLEKTIKQRAFNRVVDALAPKSRLETETGVEF